jgi:hypothetical protein
MLRYCVPSSGNAAGRGRLFELATTSGVRPLRAAVRIMYWHIVMDQYEVCSGSRHFLQHPKMPFQAVNSDSSGSAANQQPVSKSDQLKFITSSIVVTPHMYWRFYVRLRLGRNNCSNSGNRVYRARSMNPQLRARFSHAPTFAANSHVSAA